MPNVSQLEVDVRASLAAEGFVFESNCQDIVGTPDIVFREERVVVFVDGCFWHRHAGCPSARLPRTRTIEWLSRLNNVVTRDNRVTAQLEAANWTVVRLWECEIQGDPSFVVHQMRQLRLVKPTSVEHLRPVVRSLN